MQGGGGGGDRSPLPASKGRLPKAALRQFTPPVAVYNNLNPKLAMEPSIIAPPDVTLPQINMSAYGDPLSKFGTPSNGPGSGGGIGSGSGGGVGSARAAVSVLVKAAAWAAAYTAWRRRYGPGPALQERTRVLGRGRKAKYQGTVLLYIEVDSSGKATNIACRKVWAGAG